LELIAFREREILERAQICVIKRPAAESVAPEIAELIRWGDLKCGFIEVTSSRTVSALEPARERISD
jgi:hypothetical protein